MMLTEGVHHYDNNSDDYDDDNDGDKNEMMTITTCVNGNGDGNNDATGSNKDAYDKKNDKRFSSSKVVHRQLVSE